VSPTARAKARTDDEAFVAGRSLRTDITSAPLKPAPITAIRQGSAKRSWSGPAGGAARSGASGWQASIGMSWPMTPMTSLALEEPRALDKTGQNGGGLPIRIVYGVNKVFRKVNRKAQPSR
jgi:hypothetical protein